MMRRPKKFVAAAGYFAFTVLSLLVSLYLTFPADALGQRLSHELQRQTHGQWLMTYSEASTYRLTGVQLENFKLTQHPPVTHESDAPALHLEFDQLHARLRLTPLLLLRLSADVGVYTHGGSLSARITPRKQVTDVLISADKFDLGFPPLAGQFIGIPVGGQLSGHIDAALFDDFHRTTVTADLTYDRGGIGPGAIAGFTLPHIELGQIILAAELKDTKAHLTNFKQQGGNIALNIKGNTTLRQPLETSLLDLCLTLRADPTFLDNNPTIKTALQIAEVQFKKDPQGFIHIPLSGAMNSPQVGNVLCH